MCGDAVPVTMGSSHFLASQLSDVTVHAMWFPAGSHLQPHTHDRPVFGIMLDGYMKGRLGGRSYECGQHTVFIEPAGEVHDNHFASSGAHVIAVLPETYGAGRFAAFSQLLERPANYRHPAVAACAMRILGEIRAPDSMSLLAVEALVLDMLIVSARGTRMLDGSPPAWLGQMRESLHDRMLEPIRLDQLATESGVHPRHLTRHFRRWFGTSIAAYVRQLRLDWAARELRSDRSLSTVALQAGFADQSHFTRAFKAHSGVTPAQFRKLVRVRAPTSPGA